MSNATGGSMALRGFRMFPAGPDRQSPLALAFPPPLPPKNLPEAKLLSQALLKSGLNQERASAYRTSELRKDSSSNS